LAAAFGLIFGSFLNVCIYRLPRDLSVVTPRSFCPECGASVAWHDNVPVLSFALLKGRCRHCQKAIGVRYPAVELTTAVLFALVVFLYGWNLVALKWIVFESVLVVLFWTDLEERLLLDEFTLGGSVLGLLFAAFVAVPGFIGLFVPFRKELPWQSILNSASAAFLLSVPIYAIGALYSRVRRRDALGLGDVKLLVLLGTFLGVERGILALLLGSVAGSVIGIVFIKLARKSIASYELPFGSFLCAAAALIPLWSKV
jgi:leader peptidase (prepilin peptidase)/N-methyltransferase